MWNYPAGRYTYLPMKMEQSVPKRRNIKFRRRGITQKKAYNKLYLAFQLITNCTYLTPCIEKYVLLLPCLAEGHSPEEKKCN